MTDPIWYSLLPPVLAIVLAIGTRQVVPSLAAGIWLGFTILHGFDPLAGSAAALDGIVAVFADAGDARVLIFTLLIGALIATIEHSGGIRGFVEFLESRRWVHNAKRAQFLAWTSGVIIFVESNITLLVAGSVSRPLFDRYRVSREKLAYIIDSTSAPICVMIPLNAWGAVIIGLIASAGVDNPLEVFVASIAYNFYAIAAIFLVAVVIWRNWNMGPMKLAEARTQSGELLSPNAIVSFDEGKKLGADVSAKSAAFMAIPIIAMIVAMPIGLYATGDGRIASGSGSTAILWAICSAQMILWIMILATRQSSFSELIKVFMQGAGALLPIAIILLLALALGDVAKLLGTGVYVARTVSETVPAALLAPLVFLVSGFIAFSVGSSWGTFAIMIPIAVPIATTLGLPVPLLLGAAISGAIFGDHASPISDTTVVASMAAGTDHIDHVRTQLPYALLAGAIAMAAFFLAYFI